MLKIVEIGLVLQSPEGKDFRKIILLDEENLLETEYIVFRTTQPYLWKNIEKAEQHPKTISELAGHVENYNGIDIVVFEGENVTEAYLKQKWKQKERKKISGKEASERREKSNGYITDKNTGESMNQNWIPIEKDARKIKFRYFHLSNSHSSRNHSFFEWTDWFEIE